MMKTRKKSTQKKTSGMVGVKTGAKNATSEHYLKIDNLNIRYQVHRQPEARRRGRVFILPGFTEFIEKHQAQRDKFAALGFDTLCLDWPGQGLSTRLVNHPYWIHSPGYFLHLQAARAVMEDAGFLKGNAPLFLFGHSMGGHLALRLSHDLLARGDVRPQGVILCAPMLMIKAFPFGPQFMLFLLNALCRLGYARTCRPGERRLRKTREFDPGNRLTRDPEGYAVQFDLFEKNPALRSAGPTFGWVRETLVSCLQTTRNPEWMSAIDVPVQAHMAGDEEVVDGRKSMAMLGYVRDAEIHSYKDAKHELMLELPEVRTVIWDRITGFIDRGLGYSTN
jgi:lysophospholipase